MAMHAKPLAMSMMGVREMGEDMLVGGREVKVPQAVRLQVHRPKTFYCPL